MFSAQSEIILFSFSNICVHVVYLFCKCTLKSSYFRMFQRLQGFKKLVKNLHCVCVVLMWPFMYTDSEPVFCSVQ